MQLMSVQSTSIIGAIDCIQSTVESGLTCINRKYIHFINTHNIFDVQYCEAGLINPLVMTSIQAVQNAWLASW